MSIEQRNKIAELERRVGDLEKKLADTAESLAYLHGHVLGLKSNPDLEPPEKLTRPILTLSQKTNA